MLSMLNDVIIYFDLSAVKVDSILKPNFVFKQPWNMYHDGAL